nr:acyltransferase [Rhizobium sp. Q54]
MSVQSTPRSTKSEAIQALRAVAAWSVAFGHIVVASQGANGHPTRIEGVAYWASLGKHPGVDMFFVISGTIMFLVTSGGHRDGRLWATATFLIKRFARIFPLFWLTALCTVSVGAATVPADLSYLLRSLLLIDMPEAHPVAWTLVFEIRFYCIVAAVLFLFHGSIGTGFAVASIALAGSVFLTSEGVLPATWFTIPLMAEFLMGMAVGALHKYKIEISPYLLLCLGLTWLMATFVLVAPIGNVEIFRMSGYGLPSALILWSLLSLERRGLQVPVVFARAGDASYSTYLWHVPVYALLAMYWPMVGSIGAACFVALALVMTALVSIVSYALFEQPVNKLVARTISDARRRHLPASTRPITSPRL